MIERPWRLFWAVPLPEDVRSRLAAAVAGIRADPNLAADWRWNDPEGWHLTLAFLGGLPSAAVPKLVRSVADAVQAHEPFTIVTGGLGGFPSARNPRVLWYGADDPDRRLRTLARLVRNASRVVDPGPFRAHVTLARARERFGPPALPAPLPEMPVASVDVTGVTLFRSHRGRGPARYEAVGVAPLGATVAVSGR